MSGATAAPDLESQIENFDPSNPESLAALEKAAMGSAAATPTADPAQESATLAEEPKPDEKKPEAPAAEQPAAEDKGATSGAEATEKVVQAKDGKHTIPYSVLEREREQRARAEQTAQALAAQLEQLQAGKAPPAGEAVQLTEDDLTQLDQDLPGVAKVIRAQMTMIEKLTGNLQAIQQSQDAQQKTEEQARKDDEQAAIAASPTLSALQDAIGVEKPDPAAVARWNRIADTYSSLREDPAFDDLDTASLIAKAEASVTALYGPMAAASKPAAAETDKQTETNLKEQADAKLKAMPAPVPTSLSDIPGGAPPAQSDRESYENASTIAIGNKFLSMTPDQMESAIARLGL